MAPSKNLEKKKGADKKVQNSTKTLNKRKKKDNFFKIASVTASKEESKLDDKIKAKPIKTSARLPSSAEDASSNWKALCSTIKPVQFKARASFLANKRKTEKSLVALTQNLKKNPPTGEQAGENGEPDVWFDDVDPILLDTKAKANLTEMESKGEVTNEVTQVLALDCEMVGVGPEGKESALARVSIVNHHGDCVYDKFVAPGDEVTDYRTPFSGIRPHNLKNAAELGVVCHEVSAILRGRLLIGHGLRHDLEVLMIRHPKSKIRDTSKYKVFRSLVNGATPSLKRLAHQFLGIEIQSGEHSSVQDAQAAMRLYVMFRQQWETDISARRAERQNRILKGKKIKKGISDKVIPQTA